MMPLIFALIFPPGYAPRYYIYACAIFRFYITPGYALPRQLRITHAARDIALR